MGYSAPIKPLKKFKLPGKMSGDRSSLMGRNDDLRRFGKLCGWLLTRWAYSDDYNDEVASAAIRDRGELGPVRYKAAPELLRMAPWLPAALNIPVNKWSRWLDNRARHWYKRTSKPSEHPKNQNKSGLQVWKYINDFERDFMNNHKPITEAQVLAWFAEWRRVHESA